jgi:DNA-binding transcriptional MerR regulator
MRASKLISNIPGITMDHLYNWERQGYLAPGRITVGKKQVRDYTEKEVYLLKAMWSYYQNGLSPKNAYRSATEELSKKGRIAPLPLLNTRREDHQEGEVEKADSKEGIAIFELATPLRDYFKLKIGEKGRGWISKS